MTTAQNSQVDPAAPAAEPDTTKKTRKARSDKGLPKTKKGKKPVAPRYRQIQYRVGTVTKTGTGDNGTVETQVLWGRDVQVLTEATDRESATQQILQLAQHPDTREQFAGKRVQLVAVLDEFTLQIEVQAKAKVVR